MNRREDRFSGKCSKHGVWTSNNDGCPECSKEDYYAELEAEAEYFGICSRCKYGTDSRSRCCTHSQRKKFPTKPRKKKCILFEQWIPSGDNIYE